jgi:hypothetical protein
LVGFRVGHLDEWMGKPMPGTKPTRLGRSTLAVTVHADERDVDYQRTSSKDETGSEHHTPVDANPAGRRDGLATAAAEL